MKKIPTESTLYSFRVPVDDGNNITIPCIPVRTSNHGLIKIPPEYACRVVRASTCRPRVVVLDYEQSGIPATGIAPIAAPVVGAGSSPALVVVSRGSSIGTKLA
eukprot:CCRYP_008578-RA/>CCRYP_008578-RA protein AED:1.00 eAED:1.00 QI:0/0/0/0/0/0/2/0/103